MAEIRRLFIYVTPYWKWLVGAMIALIFSNLVTLALPWAIRLLVDSVFLNQDYSELNRISLGLLVLFIFQGIISFCHRYLMTFITQRVVADLRLDIHTHLLRLPLGFFANHRVGDIVSRVSNDATVLQGVMTDVPVNLLRQIVTVVGGVILMLIMNWQLTLIILAMLPPLVLISSVNGRRLKRLSTDVQDRLADATIVLEEMLSGIRVVKSFVREQYERERYSEGIENSFDASMARAWVRAIYIPTIAFFGFACMTFLLWYGGRQVINEVITPGELIAFLFYMIVVTAPMAEFANLWSRLQEALGASRRIFEILDAVPELTEAGLQTLMPDAPNPLAAMNGTQKAEADSAMAKLRTPSEFQGHVRFANVEFRYTEIDVYENIDNSSDKEAEAGADEKLAQEAAQVYRELPIVLQNINLEAQPGEVIALVGYSGSGKTTLVNLIPRFYDPSAGSIQIDGQDIRHIPLMSLRSQIGLVPQETFLFGGTVRENIAYGRLNGTDSEIEAAAEAAYAHEFIHELPDRYETIVGERGIKLSAGQRQRIAIARALLKDPRILILDEATSALDTESERWVQAALERLMQGRTSFVIAHRLSTIQRADKILVLERGQIVEQGSHERLLMGSGIYRRLHEMQFENIRTDSVKANPQ